MGKDRHSPPLSRRSSTVSGSAAVQRAKAAFPRWALCVPVLFCLFGVLPMGLLSFLDPAASQLHAHAHSASHAHSAVFAAPQFRPRRTRMLV